MTAFLQALWRLVTISALISGIIYVLLWTGQWIVPQVYPTPIGWYHAALLFSVAFFPRLLSWGIIHLVDRYRANKRKQKRRKA